jgi:hypothetical protein
MEAKTGKMVAGELHDACSAVDSERHVQAESARNPESRWNFGAIMSQKFYDHMVIAVSKLLSVGSILWVAVVMKDVEGQVARFSLKRF